MLNEIPLIIKKMLWKLELFSKYKCNKMTQFYITYRNNKIFVHTFTLHNKTKIVSEYDQEIPQLQTADNPMTPRGRAAQPSRDARKTN